MQHQPQTDSLPKNPRAFGALPPDTTQQTLAIVMGGGAGTRLFPLTKDRAKPAVPLGGKYRIVDIPISNCLNSGLRSIYVLTQFNTMSLHRHIQASYKFDNFSRSFVDILAAQQTPAGSQWYQGTADAVRQNMRYFLERPFDYYLVLSGDQLYRMDFRVQTLRWPPNPSRAVTFLRLVSCRAVLTAGLRASSRNRRMKQSCRN
jgi:dTDP-glucose pyrophosphorylase